MSAMPRCPSCGQPASEVAGAWECRNEACPEFGQDDAARARRLAFAIPPIHNPPEDIAPEWMDPEDEDDRRLLLEAAHPELDMDAETMIVGGNEMNPSLHLVMHEIVAKQLSDNDPPEVWETAQRLRRAGYRQHEILHMLGSAVSGEILHALQGRDFDHEAHLAALAALPESWERQRPGGPLPPASRDSHATEAKRRRKAQRAARRANRRR